MSFPKIISLTTAKDAVRYGEGKDEFIKNYGGKAYSVALLSAETLTPDAIFLPTCLTKVYQELGDGFLTKKSIETEPYSFNEDSLWKNIEKIFENCFYDWKLETFSVRSGAPVSMPGMMDTILNVGAVWPTKGQDNRAFKLDNYARFLESYSCVVEELNEDPFLEAREASNGLISEGFERELVLEKLVKKFEEIIADNGGKIPTTFRAKLVKAICAVYRSWNSERAISYRNMQGIDHDIGTGCIIQKMVYGNKSDSSSTGVVFSMNPNTGEDNFYGDFLINAQGEDVVSGNYKTLNISELAANNIGSFNDLTYYVRRIEQKYKDVVDVEFTIEDYTVYILQARVGKSTDAAKIPIILNLYKKGVLTLQEAVARIRDADVNDHYQLGDEVKEERAIKSTESLKVAYKGKGAVPGIVTGITVLNISEAKKFLDKGQKVIYISEQTKPGDVPIMQECNAILTSKGGIVSHAAVIARELNIPCVVGADIDNIVQYNGKEITINGLTGEVFF